MKRILTIYMCVIMIFVLTGCGSTKSNEINKQSNKEIDVNDDVSNSNKESNIESNNNKSENDSNVKKITAFSTDDWKTIAENVKKGNVSRYNLGDTKEIDMGSLGKHVLRVSNVSTPQECSKKGYSQTACGFVVEFEDIITENIANPAVEGYALGSNIGGWKDSQLRKYISTKIYNALPVDLKNVIIDTYVVSSHGPLDKVNNIVTDKLYLLSLFEVRGDAESETLTSELTRQLDYYKEKSNSLSEKEENKSKIYMKNESIWWLRTSSKLLYSDFRCINKYGFSHHCKANSSNGISPAFRIG